MRRTQLAFLSVLLIPALLPAQGGDGPRRGREGERPAPVELQHFTLQHLELPGEPPARAAVYLPKDYAAEANAERRYPWAVWLHGRGENERKFQTDGGANVLDELRGKGEIPELIFVALGLGRQPIYIDGTAAGDQEKLIVEVLPRVLAEKYRLAADRAQRALMGVSMGGFGALKIALRHPEKFGVAAVHSAALMPADPEALAPQYQRTVQRMLERGGLAEVFGNPIDADKWRKEMPLALAATLDAEKLKTLHLYFDAGTDDRYGFAPPNQELHALLEKRGVPHSFELVAGGGHSWGSGTLQKQLVKSLQFVGGSFTGKPAAPGNGESK